MKLPDKFKGRCPMCGNSKEHHKSCYIGELQAALANERQRADALALDNASQHDSLLAAKYHIDKLTEGRSEELKHAEQGERQRCAEIARKMRGTHGCTVAEEIAAAIMEGDKC